MTRQEASTFYRTHSKPLYNTALRILRDRAEAEEIMQDTLLKYISSGVVSKTSAQAAAWLRTTCIRKAIDRLRARKRMPSFVGETLALQEEPADDEPQESPVDLAKILDAIRSLPAPYGFVVNLVLIEGLGYGEIARMTGQKESTLRSIYSRGKAKLAQMIKAQL